MTASAVEPAVILLAVDQGIRLPLIRIPNGRLEAAGARDQLTGSDKVLADGAGGAAGRNGRRFTATGERESRGDQCS
jgi:hypothetical protein